MPRLRFHEREITKIASRYDYSISEKELEQLRPKVIKRGYLLSEKKEGQILEKKEGQILNLEEKDECRILPIWCVAAGHP